MKHVALMTITGIALAQRSLSAQTLWLVGGIRYTVFNSKSAEIGYSNINAVVMNNELKAVINYY